MASVKQWRWDRGRKDVAECLSINPWKKACSHTFRLCSLKRNNQESPMMWMYCTSFCVVNSKIDVRPIYCMCHVFTKGLETAKIYVYAVCSSNEQKSPEEVSSYGPFLPISFVKLCTSVLFLFHSMIRGGNMFLNPNGGAQVPHGESTWSRSPSHLVVFHSWRWSESVQLDTWDDWLDWAINDHTVIMVCAVRPTGNHRGNHKHFWSLSHQRVN